jgi:hypothetical protein
MKLFVKYQHSKRLPAAPRASAALAMIAALHMSVVASAQIPLDDADRAADAGRPLIITTTAERVKTTLSNGRESIELLPADRLVAGDVVRLPRTVWCRRAAGARACRDMPTARSRRRWRARSAPRSRAWSR